MKHNGDKLDVQNPKVNGAVLKGKQKDAGVERRTGKRDESARAGNGVTSTG
jgi:hypothetical protein